MKHCITIACGDRYDSSCHSKVLSIMSKVLSVTNGELTQSDFVLTNRRFADWWFFYLIDEKNEVYMKYMREILRQKKLHIQCRLDLNSDTQT